MENPLVSVIIPVYNVEQFLRECLDSVLNQTYKEIEIIAINDGSTDNSLSLLEEYAKNHENMKVISQENKGQSASRNKGIQIAKGKYVHFLDADDYVLPETYGNLVQRMEAGNLDITLFAAEPFVEDVEMKVFKKQYDLRKYYDPKKIYTKKEYLQVLQQAFSVSPCLYLIKREVLVKHGLEFEPGILHEDELFSLRLYLQVEAVMYDPNFYYKRRYRSDSTMTTNQNKHVKRSFDSYWTVIKKMGELSKDYTEPLEQKLIKRRMGKLYSILAKSDLEPSYKKEKLQSITELSQAEKLYYGVKGNVKKVIKKIIVR